LLLYPVVASSPAVAVADPATISSFWPVLTAKRQRELQMPWSLQDLMTRLTNLWTYFGSRKDEPNAHTSEHISSTHYYTSSQSGGRARLWSRKTQHSRDVSDVAIWCRESAQLASILCSVIAGGNVYYSAIYTCADILFAYRDRNTRVKCQNKEGAHCDGIFVGAFYSVASNASQK
jgi:hypothetical protein